jgi:glycosyltransferase involved in cell wall biosynthesis
MIEDPKSRLPGQRSYRVLMIAPTSFFADYGCHVRILEEARALQALGHSVTIVTYRNGGAVAGLDIRRTLPIPWRQHYEVGSSHHKLAFDALLFAKAAMLLAREHFDVIHAHLHEGALIGNLLGRLTRTPLVFDFQGSLTAEMTDHHFLKPDSAFLKPLLRLEGWLDRISPVVFTSSTRARQLLLEKFDCRAEQVVSLPDCVNAEVFRPATDFDPGELAALRDRLGAPAGRKVIVYLGLLAEYQGTGLLLEAMSRLLQQGAPAHLLLMGFPNVEGYQQQARALGIAEHVTFTGRVPYDQAPIHLALGDVAVAPKLSLTEGSGKLLNYMAAALPTVAFDTPVAREYLVGDGVYARLGDAEDLARKLGMCLSSEPEAVARRLEAGQRLRQRSMQRYDWESAGRVIEGTYRQLLGDAPTQAAPAQAAVTPMGGERV